MSCSEIDCTSSILIILSIPGAKILASLTLSINLLPPRKIINFLFSRIVIKFNGFRFLAMKSIILCILNIVISCVFIKEKGVIGAAFALILVEAISLFANFLFKPAKFLNVIFKIGVTKS